MSKRKKAVINRVEKLEGEDWVLWYTHAVYYTGADGCPHKFLCKATDELDAYQQAKHNIGKESNNVIQSNRV
jgi:hypothetical protein